MPNKPKEHVYMLQICCGIFSQKKTQKQLRKLTNHILMKIKCIDEYRDDRFPKMICNKDWNAVHK